MVGTYSAKAAMNPKCFHMTVYSYYTLSWHITCTAVHRKPPRFKHPAGCPYVGTAADAGHAGRNSMTIGHKQKGPRRCLRNENNRKDADTNIRAGQTAGKGPIGNVFGDTSLLMILLSVDLFMHEVLPIFSSATPKGVF